MPGKTVAETVAFAGALGSERGGQLWVQHLERNRSFVLPVVRQVHGGNAAAQLALESVAISQSFLQLVAEVCHGCLGTTTIKTGTTR
jgi:hypothetical protein